ncbi:MAG: sugar phosphate isomerase/epimerase [Halioglobus sp.]
MNDSRLTPAIGLQLYTVRELMERDLGGTLAAIAAMGYSVVEFAGYFNHSPAEITQLLNAEGLDAPSAHIAPQALIDQPEMALDDAASAGHRYVVLPGWEEALRNREGYYQLAELLNQVGELARARGLGLAYHNHDFEFSIDADWIPYDFLLTHTDPSCVSYELDLYWAIRAGRTPAELFSTYPGRFTLLHAKDMDANGSETDIGKGQIDFANLLRALPLETVEYLFVERDEPEEPMASAALGLTRLNALSGA